MAQKYRHGKRGGAEKLSEIVSYNLMQYLRKKMKKPNLCKIDFSKSQLQAFDRCLKRCLKEGIMCDNPFADEERLLLISLEMRKWLN